MLDVVVQDHGCVRAVLRPKHSRAKRMILKAWLAWRGAFHESPQTTGSWTWITKYMRILLTIRYYAT